MNNAKHLKRVLLNSISRLSYHREFLSNPDKDFTRNRKLPLPEIIKCILTLEAGTIKDELYRYFDYHSSTPTASALIQQRKKIKYEAFRWLFDSFNFITYISKHHLYKGYRLLAIDGATTVIPTNHNNQETYVEKQCKGGFNAFHINALYDLLEHTYDDVVIQGEPSKDENQAFRDLVDRYLGRKAIFIADRGYENYNGFEHVAHSGNKYLIRVKDIGSYSSIAGSLVPNQEGEFDVDVFRMLTRKQTLMTKACPQLYKFLPNNTQFDYMDKENSFYEFNCRIVRFQLDIDTYECIITNLDRKKFSTKEIKELYHMRWGIETSFRELKYAVCLNAFHSKNSNLIKQEIYARLLFYNFSQRIMQQVKPRKGKKERKYSYQINATQAFHNIRAFLRYKKGGKHPPDIEAIIAREIEPIRPGRSYPRNVKPKSAKSYIYRYD